MGLCTPVEYPVVEGQTPASQRILVSSGNHLYKYWFLVNRAEHHARFKARQNDPLKRWKLSPIDLRSLDKWADYTRSKEAMFFYTDTADAPWMVIKSDDKKRARLNCMQYFLVRLLYPEKTRRFVWPPDPLIVSPVRHVLDLDRVAEAMDNGAS